MASVKKLSTETRPAPTALVADPNITIGNPDGLHVRILKRTDGPYVIFDPRQKPGCNAVVDEQGGVRLFRTEEAAAKAAQRFLWEEMGRPEGRWITRETWEPKK